MRTRSWEEEPGAHDRTVRAVRDALESFGVMTLDRGVPSTGGAGVRFLSVESDGDVAPCQKPLWNQIKAARFLAGWRQLDLATASGVGLMTVRRAEHAETWHMVQPSLAQHIADAFFQRARILCFSDGVIVNGGAGACFLPGQTPQPMHKTPVSASE